MGSYAPPFEGRPGRLSLGPPGDGGQRDYWETTPSFDRAIAAALAWRGADLPAPELAVTASNGPRWTWPALTGAAALGAGGALAALYWLKSITRRGGDESSKTR